MLRMSVAAEEYLMIGDNIKLVFLGGTAKHMRIMIDAPREINIIRSSVLEKNAVTSGKKADLPRYYKQEEHPEKYRKKPETAVKKGRPCRPGE